MKKYPNTALKAHQASYETDIEDSYHYYTFQNSAHDQNRRKKPAKKSKQLTHVIFPKKILRFRLQNLRRTLRVPAYEEEQLNLPYRFTKKLHAMEVDNDLETDEEAGEHGVEKCCKWLQEAIRANQELKKHKNSQ